MKISTLLIGLLILTSSFKNSTMVETTNNPLIQQFATPFETVPFDLIQNEHFEPAFNFAIAQAEAVFKAVLDDKNAPTFANTILPIEEKTELLSRLGSILFNLNSVETNDTIQEITQKISPILTKFSSEMNLNEKYFSRINSLYQKRFESGLTLEEIRLVEITYRNMKRNGANLSENEKSKLVKLQMQLSKLTLKFNQNVLAETNAYQLHLTDSAQLAGLPESNIEIAAKTATEKGVEGWLFTLHFPSYAPFMKYAEDRSLREKMYKAYTTRGNNANINDNNKLVEEIVNLRLKKSQMLGYKSYTDYVLEERMAKTPERVNSFISELHAASKPFATKELVEVTEFAHSKGFVGEIMPWDVSFYSEKLKNTKFGFDEEMLKPYFKLENVIDGVFQLTTDLFGLKYTQVTNIQVYNPAVKTYKVYDVDGKFLSILYLDFHPRQSKQGGAWMTDYRSQSNISGNSIRPHVSLCCNFTPSTSNEPSLLEFQEVNTFLHEFGHALHGMLANTVYPSLSGTSVYRDFVELPSQLLENWLTEKEWLDKFAIHYKTGEKMPEELVKKLIGASNFMAGYQSERQLSFGMNDMAWHSITEPFSGSVKAFEKDAIAPTQLFPDVETSCLSTSFSHIFAGGYASGYYGYKWAEVLDADAFAKFKTDGIFNKNTAELYRKTILEKGGTEDPMELYKAFRGSEPSITPLLERSGLK